jgi:cob(I)alamin adenosyltransferase
LCCSPTAGPVLKDTATTKIYTRTGDAGETMLLGGRRVKKDDIRVEAFGTVDELNAALGVARAELIRAPSDALQIDQLLGAVQHRLFDLGAELATPPPGNAQVQSVSDAEVAVLEAAIDRHEALLEPLRAFILPGGTPVAAQLHLARCVCRRAERRLISLSGSEQVRGETIRYLNRLSDLLFVLARSVNRSAGVPDVPWQQGP